MGREGGEGVLGGEGGRECGKGGSEGKTAAMFCGVGRKGRRRRMRRREKRREGEGGT